MKKLSKEVHKKQSRPIKVLQFGEGNFLRAFVDGFISDLNERGDFNGNVAVVQPLEHGRIEELTKQDGLYTLLLEGIEDGKLMKTSKVIDVLEEFINPYEQFDRYLNLAKSKTLEIILSNTTEAGIVYEEIEFEEGKCFSNFPAKLLVFLKERYEHFGGSNDSGLYILPCELIDYNGTNLKDILNKLSKFWGLSDNFILWLNNANTFCNTLVDRIVPGYPKDSIEEITKKLGYTDDNVVKGEIFHLWVIENKGDIKNILKLEELGLNVKFVDDITPYKQQKVRILNGAHSSMVPVSYLYGIDTVGESMQDQTISKFVQKVMFDEVIPATKHILSEEELKTFANGVVERFSNPTIRHELLSISLNGTTKYKTRILPSVMDYIENEKKLPKALLLSLASTLVFFRGIRGEETYLTKDNPEFIEMYKELWASYDGSEESVFRLVGEYLGLENHWGVKLTEVSGIHEYVSSMVFMILNESMAAAVEKVLNE